MENLDFNIEHWQDKKCPPVNCRKKACECGLEKVFLSSALGDDSKDSPIAPKNGAYCNAIVVYEANNHVYIYSKEGIPTLVEAGGSDVEDIIEQLEDQLAQEILDRQAADNTLQGEIDDLKNSPDVVDIVPTYAALQAYDTSHLGDNDIIRVLQDEQHDGDSTYYRWNKQAETWTYIGGISVVASIVFYADNSETGDTRHIYKDVALTEMASFQDILDANEKGQVILRTFISQTPERYGDVYLQRTSMKANSYYDFSLMFLGNFKYYNYFAAGTSATVYNYTESGVQGTLTAGTNITITGNTISATDTTYSNFTGTDGQTAGTAGLVPAPATTDADKFLKSDGTWSTAGGGGDTVYSTKTTSDRANGGAVYIGNLNSSQQEQPDPTVTDYHFKYFWALPYSNSNEPGDKSINILGTNARANFSIALGEASSVIAGKDYGVAIGNSAIVRGKGSIAIGKDAYIDTNIENSLALGRGSTPTRSGEVNIGAGTTGYGYNSTNYRLLGGVHDPIAAHDAATKNYVDSIVVNYATLTAAGAPTTSTAATSVGQLYYDSTNDDYYYCSAIDTTDPDNPVYTWSALSTGGGGGGDIVYSTKTTSNTADGGAVYIGGKNSSQVIYMDPTTTDNHRRYFWALPYNTSGTANTTVPGNESVNIGGDQSGGGSGNITIGYRTTCSGEHNVNIGYQAGNALAYGSCVCIGDSAQCSQNYSIALGRSAQVGQGHTGAIALGAYSQTTRGGEVNVGTTGTYAGYNNTNYRVIGGVYNGQELHDAATVAQGNTLATAAPDSSTVGVLGQLWTDTTNMHTYQCTAISGSTYTWTQRW